LQYPKQLNLDRYKGTVILHLICVYWCFCKFVGKMYVC